MSLKLFAVGASLTLTCHTGYFRSIYMPQQQLRQSAGRSRSDRHPRRQPAAANEGDAEECGESNME